MRQMGIPRNQFLYIFSYIDLICFSIRKYTVLLEFTRKNKENLLGDFPEYLRDNIMLILRGESVISRSEEFFLCSRNLEQQH
jgi:hypothetical protein